MAQLSSALVRPIEKPSSQGIVSSDEFTCCWPVVLETLIAPSISTLRYSSRWTGAKSLAWQSITMSCPRFIAACALFLETFRAEYLSDYPSSIDEIRRKTCALHTT